MRVVFPLFILCLYGSRVLAAGPVCVVKAEAKLRKGPGREYAVTWRVPRYMPLLEIERKGAWLKVHDLEGETHWVYAKEVSHRTNCAVVKTKTAKLRRGPGRNQPLADLASVDRYTPFQKIDREGEWIRVKDDFNGSYWVHETNVWIPVTRAKLVF